MWGGGGSRRVIRVNRFPAVSGLPQPGRTLVMGVVNVTPDSFSDGGEWFQPRDAIEHGLELIDEGGESTRPGAARPDVAEELRRVLPVVSELAATGTVVSIDTMRPRVAAEAVASGARLINDVSGGQADPDMLPLVAGLGLPYVCMHWRGHSTDMQSRATYGDVVADVIAELGRQVDSVLEAGITKDQLIIDPGFGYAKTGEHNWQLLQHIHELAALELPVLAGVYRKTFLGTLLAAPDGSPRPPKDREDATVALTTLLASRGIWGVRVHCVRASRDAIAVVDRMAAP